MRRWTMIGLFCVLPALGVLHGQKKTPLSKATDRAVRLSQLTLQGSAPFHLKATIAELGSPDSDYKADIEQYWVAPDKWRRVISTPDFSETLIVNGNKVLEEVKGDYFPRWLQEFLTAMFNPLPFRGLLERSTAQIAAVPHDAFSVSCAQLELKFYAKVIEDFVSICFRGEGLLESVVSPDYAAEFKDYQRFKDKFVPRRIVMNLEPGTAIEARITEVRELPNADPGLFFVSQPTPDKNRMLKVKVSEGVARKNLLSSPEIAWAPVRDGRTGGTLRIFVCIDRGGHVRETYPLSSDNPVPQDQARKEVMKWRFKPLEINGMPAQVETILTFTFQTTIANPIPVLTDAEARSLAITTAEPEFRFQRPPKELSSLCVFP